jgi:hypothetical protein
VKMARTFQGRHVGLALVMGLLTAPVPGARPAVAQASLDQVIASAQAAWLAHDVSDLVSGSDTVRLRLPGIAPSASLKPGQAARLLEQYLKPTKELSFGESGRRELASDHVYAEMQRIYVVKGTDEERSETVLLGFRRIDGRWVLREVRVTP